MEWWNSGTTVVGKSAVLTPAPAAIEKL